MTFLPAGASRPLTINKKGGLMLIRALFIIACVTAVVSCRKDHRVDAVRSIPDHSTSPKIVHGADKACLEYTTFPFRWDLGEITGERVQSDTCTLGASVLVCHTADEVNRHTAWVKRILPPVLDDVLEDLGVEDYGRKIALMRLEEAIETYIVLPSGTADYGDDRR